MGDRGHQHSQGSKPFALGQSPLGLLHRDDPMAGLYLVEEDYAWVTRQMKIQAEKSARGRIVSTLEGGYDLNALGRSVHAHITALAE